MSRAPPHKAKNSSSKLIFAQNVLSKIKKKDEVPAKKQKRPFIDDVDNESGVNSRPGTRGK